MAYSVTKWMMDKNGDRVPAVIENDDPNFMANLPINDHYTGRNAEFGKLVTGCTVIYFNTADKIQVWKFMDTFNQWVQITDKVQVVVNI